VSLLFPELPEYRPNETARLSTAGELQDRTRRFSVRDLAKKARLSPATIQAVKTNKRIRKKTAIKLLRALERVEMRDSEADSTERKAS
jgi:hypothetical protein